MDAEAASTLDGRGYEKAVRVAGVASVPSRTPPERELAPARRTRGRFPHHTRSVRRSPRTLRRRATGLVDPTARKASTEDRPVRHY